MVAQSFMFGPGTEYKTAEDLDRARDLVKQMYGGIGKATGPYGWADSLSKGLMTNIMNRRIAQGQSDFNKNRAEADSSFLSGMSGLNAPAVPSSVAAGGSPTAPAATGVAAPEGIRDGIVKTATALGIDPVDLGTAISYETAGTFDPRKKGPRTQWGQHEGLIQFGEPQAQKYGVDWNNPVGSQLGENGAVANYLRDAGVKPGMGMMDVYSAINAGRVGRYGASDANNGGAPGTVADKVNQQMAGHRAKAMALLGMDQQASKPVQTASLDTSSGMAQAFAPQAFAPEQFKNGMNLGDESQFSPEDQQRIAQRRGPAPTTVPYSGPGARIDTQDFRGDQAAPQQNNYPEQGKVAPVDWTDQPQYSVAAGMQFANGQQPQGQQVASLPPQQPQTPQAVQDGRLPGVSDAMLRANDQMLGGMFAPQGQQPVQVADNGGYFPPAPDASQPSQQQPRQTGNQLEFYARQMSNPFLSPEMKKLALYQYQQEAERQQKASDPMYQLNLQKGQMEIDALKRGKSALLNAGNGQLYNPNTNEWITAPDSGKEKETTDIQNYNYAKQNNGYTGTLADWVNGVKRGKNSATVNGNTIDLENLPPVSMNEQGTPDPASQAEFLSKLPTSLRAQVQGISEGRIPIEKVTSMRGGERQELARIVSLFDPTFDMSQAGARVAIRKDYASGEMAKLAASSNLALQHAGGMLDAAEKLDNGQYPWVNAAGNYFASKTGQGAQSAFETYRLGVADELGKAFHGVGAVPVETVKEWKNAISTSSSPEQLRAAVDAAVHMLAARTETYNQRYKNVMGQDAPSFLTPESVKTLTKMGIDASVLDPRYVDKSAGKGSQPVNINGYTIKKVQ